MRARTAPDRRPCENTPDLFSAPDGEKFHSAERLDRISHAKALCLTCPIMQACREEGRKLREPGIWGGESDEERAAAGHLTLPHHLRNRRVSLAA